MPETQPQNRTQAPADTADTTDITDTIRRHTFDSGLVLLAEPMPGVHSLAIDLTVPAGLAAQPADRQGVAPLMSEWVNRGAGGLDARGHADALDHLGVRRSTGAGTRTAAASASLLGTQLDDALPLVLDMLLRPNLDDAAFAPSLDLQLQALDSLEDEPQQQCMIELRRRHLPDPLNRHPEGDREALGALTADDARAFWAAQARPGGAVLSFAGNLDWDRLVEAVAAATEGWTGHADWAAGRTGADTSAPEAGTAHHLPTPSSQTHIGLAYPGLPADHPDLPLQEAAVAVLSGGMSGRLFTEVREKRGLCYSVYASHAAGTDRGDVYAYAGTTTARAQETLDVLTAELRRMAEGVTASEFDRARVGMKAGLVMQGESSGARAGAINHDQLMLGRPRTLAERAAAIDAITPDRLNAWLASNPPGAFTTVALGEAPLNV